MDGSAFPGGSVFGQRHEPLRRDAHGHRIARAGGVVAGHVGAQRGLAGHVERELHAVAQEAAVRHVGMPPAGLAQDGRLHFHVFRPDQPGAAGGAWRHGQFQPAQIDTARRGVPCARLGQHQAVHPPQEGCHERVRRGAVERLAVAHLHDAPGLHHGQPVGDGERLLLVVRDVDGGDVQAAQQLGQFVAQRFLELGVECGEGLVTAAARAARRHGAGQGHALALAAGKFRGAALLQPVQAHQVDQLAHHAAAFHLGRAADLQAIADVALHRHLRKQRIVLEHHAHAALLDGQLRHVGAAEGDAGAGVRRLQPGDQAQQRGLAAARGAQQRQHLARLHGQVGGLQAARAAGIGLRAADDVHARAFEFKCHGVSR